MSKLYVLTIETSLPKTCKDHSDLKREVRVFSTFEAAKNSLFEKTKQLVAVINHMFDKNGYILYFKEEYDWLFDKTEDWAKEELKAHISVQEAFKNLLGGQSVDTSSIPASFEDIYIGYTFDQNTFSMTGAGEGPCNGCDPYIKTNMFNMEKENNYYLCINDIFGQNDCSSELYIYLDVVDME